MNSDPSERLSPERAWPVAILGATGAVGQTFVRLLARHPWFRVAEVAASERSVGRRYGDAVRWLEGELPEEIARLQVLPCDPAEVRSPLVFSALDSSVAGSVEESFARAGALVFSNAKNHRMDPDVPLLIAEVNPSHRRLLAEQRRRRGWSGGIVTNPNCAATVAAMALAPLHERFGVRAVTAFTMQAVSGAGYPGVPSLDILANVIPYIAEEEEKVERELRKLLGDLGDHSVVPADFAVSAHCNRVPTEHGHMVCMSVRLEFECRPTDVIAALCEWRGAAETRALPSAPRPPIVYRAEPDRPQARRDVWTGGGMAVTVGRVRSDPAGGIKLVALGHNTYRGAAGCSVLNAELVVADQNVRTA
ncbi:MAG TPA: aspartate-semialdehyde dehydrogenase [Gemmatimonadaceae bacterium]|nr:aspartate-semialdehyde dehydrogenase [Gemmatimonadaceae bacterium]